MPESRALLEQTAVDLLIAGDASASVAELAGLRADESGWIIDSLVERVTDELDLHEALTTDPEILLIRRLCRSVLAGTTDERQLAARAHTVFHHESDSPLMNELALLEDEFDDAVWPGTDLEPFKARVREIAAEVVAGAE
jgi:hypothetical protein